MLIFAMIHLHHNKEIISLWSGASRISSIDPEWSLQEGHFGLLSE